MQSIKAVFFDVGETLIDETRHWASWADWLGVPRFAFFGAFGAVIERDEHHHRTFEIIRPGIDLDAEKRARKQAGADYHFDLNDLYPDVRPCLQTLHEQGLVIGLAGNQPERAEELLHAMGLPVDVVASSARWGVHKPSPEFFERVEAAAGVPAQQIAYVGDRLDNDVLPSRAAGMVAVFVRRGPWGYIHATRPQVMEAHLRIEGLDELPRALGVV